MTFGRKFVLKLLAYILVAIVVIAVGAALPFKAWIQLFTGWAQQLGPVGVLAFALAYVVAVVLLFPTWILTVSAGVAFGLWGIPLVVISATVGASLAFAIARVALREKLRVWARKKPVLQALDKTSRDDGWKVVGLLRLSPVVPFNLQNYAFGATDIPAWHFIIPTLIGIIPGTSLYVYIGTLGRVATSEDSVKSPQIILFVIGFFATLAVIVIVTRKARLMLKQIGLNSV